MATINVNVTIEQYEWFKENIPFNSRSIWIREAIDERRNKERCERLSKSLTHGSSSTKSSGE